MEINNFTELVVWQRAMELVVEVYRVTEAFPRAERFGLTAQIRRSVISIPSNVAEGFRRKRRSLASYINHLDIALGSEGELFTQLDAARRLRFVPANALDKSFADLGEIGRMLNGLIASLDAVRGRSR
jgi:four helix bundle protein